MSILPNPAPVVHPLLPRVHPQTPGIRMAQARRLRLAASLPFTDVLVHELRNYRVTIDPHTAHDSYSAWREKDHDDLVLALALACWWGERQAKYQAGVW